MIIDGERLICAGALLGGGAWITEEGSGAVCCTGDGGVPGQWVKQSWNGTAALQGPVGAFKLNRARTCQPPEQAPVTPWSTA